MNYIRHMSGFFSRVSQDQRMTPFHVSLYMALFQLWNLNRFRNPFTISRDETMHLSLIGSVNTYARCIKQLQEWGYIRYVPTANNYFGSHVTCISFDTGRNTGTDTGSDTSSDTGCDTSSDTSSDTGSDTGTDTGSDTASYYINITNFNKQDTNKNLRNGRGKNPSGNHQIHVANDKDYSEPL
jgi:hypothetical protein